MKTFDKYLSRVENFLAGASLIGATALAVFAVLLRNITGDVLFWSEEAIIYLIICSTFFGAVVTLRHNEHVAVDIMPTLLKGKKKKFFVVLGGLMTLIYAGFIAYLSWALISEPFSRTTNHPGAQAAAVGRRTLTGDRHDAVLHPRRRNAHPCGEDTTGGTRQGRVRRRGRGSRRRREGCRHR